MTPADIAEINRLTAAVAAKRKREDTANYERMKKAMQEELGEEEGEDDAAMAIDPRLSSSSSMSNDCLRVHQSRSEIEITPERIRAGIDTSQNFLSGRLMLSSFTYLCSYYVPVYVRITKQ